MTQETMKTTNFMLVGVGGQGTILASNLLAELGVQLGYDVKKAEVHGMSQRGGSVVSHLRLGRQVFAPIVSKGQVDILLAFEQLEAARYIDYLRPGGLLLINDFVMKPASVTNGKQTYPERDKMEAIFAAATDNHHWVQGAKIADQIGNPKVANVVLLGALCRLMDMHTADYEAVIEQRLPAKLLQINLKAFRTGHQAT
ncbi:MAG: indolepyruvate oxidoreductase subunit beta [Anaerolineaceae bacterium]|nr:indolepyruvate oxidoreductase subunit beta [Anaerolineaceae bacterium]